MAGDFTLNVGEQSGQRGGGVLLHEANLEVFTQGLINGNTAKAGGGGGVFPGTLRVSGAPAICTNYIGSNKSDCFLGYQTDGGHRIIVTGPLTSQAYLVVEHPWPGNNAPYPITAGLGTGGNLGAFSCDDFDYEVCWDYYGTEAEIVLRGSGPAQPTHPSQPTATPTAKPTAMPKPTATPKPTQDPRISLSQCKIASIENQIYTGKKLQPDVTVKYGKKTLKKDKDYTVAYADNKAVGDETYYSAWSETKSVKAK